MNGDDNKLVFVSYAHKDREFLDEELMPFLRQLELGEQIELWHDRLIGTGDNWYAEIADRLDQAKVAILLITPPFLGSKFCLHEEVPVLRSGHQVLEQVQRSQVGPLQIVQEQHQGMFGLCKDVDEMLESQAKAVFGFSRGQRRHGRLRPHNQFYFRDDVDNHLPVGSEGR